MAVPTRADLDRLIKERLASDPSFAAELTANPRAAISQLVGMELPAALVIDVHQESLAHLHIVVPVLDDGGELQEEDLELVVGAGVSWIAGSKTPVSQKPASGY
jgi:hypothetical protein